MSLLASSTITSPVDAIPDPNFADLPWYRWWLYRQIRSQPQRLFLALPNLNWEEESDWDTHFLPIWNKVRELLLVPEPQTIDGIADILVKDGAMTVEGNYEAYQSAKELVFSILGWQTMLYKPDISSYTTGEFNILDETDGCYGEARLCLQQSPLGKT